MSGDQAGLATWSVARLDEGLVGSPYSIPADSESRRRVEPMLERIHALNVRAVTAQAAAVHNTLQLLRRSQRVREIYESNKIEGLGPSLARTNEVLASREAQDIAKVIKQYSLTKTLSSDPKVQDVLGLHGAKLLAEEIVRHDASERPLTEADLRGMHALIMGSDAGAGRYKRYTNTIAGSLHDPHLPSDVPASMSALATWVQQRREAEALPPVVACAAAHAWLTHIHPYEDGNGRIARLLANIIIGSAALPPLIVKSTGDRGKYIQALAHSDEGGDLALLISVFIRVLTRALRDMENPKFALKLFEDELAARALGDFDRWTAAFAAWMTDFGAVLLLNGLHLEHLGSFGREDFQRLREGGGHEAAWIARITSDSDERSEAVLILDRPDALARYAPRGIPSMYLLRPTGHLWSIHQYARSGLVMPISEALILAESPHRTYVMESYGRVRMGHEDAPTYVAEHLANAFRSGAFRALGRAT